ncbi:uracil-DNA glycosylase [Rhodohalobacter mucosus]|uniref:Uracil-DNA glycosylase-like domain-containing protein n=1 Tax=Rhodohalobacter mucosus TaxID=2079485 RepID=A0A316TY51_9BACT|nr:uracil-DNA glycosylase [Rhodohalobacter mucosus]PWN07722.1 hypothetical protein DDZ15_01495 [Rhodohalobacter mucosus]
MQISSGISGFVRSLKKTPRGLFNPWYHYDKAHDLSADAPVIRKRQFEHYLAERQGRAKFLLIAEALGYQGGHFTGMAMTSERILLGHQESRYGIRPGHVFKSIEPQRTSKPEINDLGMSEPTATIVWGSLIKLGIDPYEVVLWNAVPWHPYKKDNGMLTNRTPLTGEMEAGLRHLRDFIALFPDSELIAVGRKCEQSLKQLELKHRGVRHPANGGAPAFRRQFAAIYSETERRN